MSKYIVVTTLCDKEEIKDKIIDSLLEKRLVAGSQVSIVKSKYLWNNNLEENDEYKIEFRTRKDLYKEIEEEIKSIHDYEVCEISYYEIDGSNEFIKWIDDSVRSETHFI